MKRIIFIALTFIFSLTLTPVFSQAAKDNKFKDNKKEKSDLDFNIVDDSEENDATVMSLWNIRRMISQKKLSEALSELQRYIEAKPDNFDNAQILIEVIMKRRLLYTDYAQKAMESSINNPEDDETPSLFIKRMEEIEINPPEEMKKVVRQLKELHLFKYYQKKFNTILETSTQLADNNQTSEAFLELLNGFDIYLPEFIEQYGEDSEIVKKAENISQELTLLINESALYTETGTLEDSVAKFNICVQEGRYVEAEELFKSFEKEFRQYIALLNKTQEISLAYSQLEDELRSSSEDFTDANYVSFMHHYITGISEIQNSGMNNILSSKLYKSMDSMKSTVDNKVVQVEKEFRERLPGKILADNFNLTSGFIRGTFKEPAESLLGFNKSISELYNSVDGVSPDVVAANERKLIDYEYLVQMGNRFDDVLSRAQRLKVNLEKQASFFADLETVKSDENTNSQVDRLFASLAEIAGITGIRKDLLPESYDWGAAYLDNFTVGVDMNWNPVTGIYVGYVDEMFDNSQDVIETAWRQISLLYRSDSNIFAKEIERYSESLALLDTGLNNVIEDQNLTEFNRKGNEKELFTYLSALTVEEGDEALIKYPELITKFSDFVIASSQNYISILEEEKKTLHSNVERNEDWMTNSQIKDYIDNADKYISERLAVLKDRINDAEKRKDKALKDIQMAKNARTEAERLLKEAQTATDRENFEDAEEYLDKARTKYYESLSYSEDSALRQESYEKRTDLENKIIVGKNNIIVREIRSMLDVAKTAYNLEEYDRALSIISNAEDRWSVTNPDNPNQELSDFKALIEIANSITTGRTLDPNDPVYSIVSQNLSFANQYYESAEKQKKTGKSDDYKKSLSLSEDYISQVKLVYPKNRAASILQLKIDRLRDPEAFKTEFDHKIQAAVNKVDNGNQEAKEEGLNDLYAYQQLEPNYKNLNTIVLNAEYSTGKKRRPVTNREQTQAVRYIQDAERYYNTAKNDADYQKAIDAADRAIALLDKDSTYITRAQKVKDNSLLKKTPPIPVLSVSDEGLYEQIQSAFIAQNYDKARNLMNSLLNKNSSYIKIDRVKKLYDNIERQLSN